jgi:pimeloyl-ACP methyl ester carboxylesterase
MMINSRAARSCHDPRVLHKTYTLPSTGEVMPYALFAPSDPPNDPQGAPLLVLLHGFGGEYDSMLSAKFDGLLDAAEKQKMFLVTPLGYHRMGWYGSRTKQIMGGRDCTLESNHSEEDVMEVLTLMREAYTIDPERIFLCGHSMGGAGALHLAMKFPKLWAAVALFCPAVPGRGGKVESDDGYKRTMDDLNLVQRPLFVVVGTEDKFQLLEPVRAWVARMKDFNIRHDFVVVQGGGHGDILGSQLGRMMDFFVAGRLKPDSSSIVIELPKELEPPKIPSDQGQPRVESSKASPTAWPGWLREMLDLLAESFDVGCCSARGPSKGGYATVISDDPLSRWDGDAMCEGHTAGERAAWLHTTKKMTPQAAKLHVMREHPKVFGEVDGVVDDPLSRWDGDAMCEGFKASGRAYWLHKNRNLTPEAAKLQVMREYPEVFGVNAVANANAPR